MMTSHASDEGVYPTSLDRPLSNEAILILAYFHDSDDPDTVDWFGVSCSSPFSLINHPVSQPAQVFIDFFSPVLEMQSDSANPSGVSDPLRLGCCWLCGLRREP